jgi:hypothetical protein
MLLMNNWLQAAVLLLVVLLVLPPVSSLIKARFGWPIHIAPEAGAHCRIAVRVRPAADGG